MALAVFDAGGAAPLCDILALAATILLDPLGRRPRGRRLRAGVSEKDGLHQVLSSVELALDVLFYALQAGQEEAAIDHDGIDPVARTVLDVGGHVGLVQFQMAARTGSFPSLDRSMLDDFCNRFAAPVLGEIALRPRAHAAIVEAVAAERQRAARTAPIYAHAHA